MSRPPVPVACRNEALSLVARLLKLHFRSGGSHAAWFRTSQHRSGCHAGSCFQSCAQRAEARGYETLWTIERLLWPVKLQTPYPATPDGSLPEQYKHSLDPIEALTFAAAQTKKIGLGTSVLDIPYYNPAMLARRLTTLDYLSNGRLRIGLGLGWSKDEMDAVGASMKGRGARAEEFIQVLKAIWTTNPVNFTESSITYQSRILGQNRCRSRTRPIYMAAFVPPALKKKRNEEHEEKRRKHRLKSYLSPPGNSIWNNANHMRFIGEQTHPVLRIFAP